MTDGIDRPALTVTQFVRLIDEALVAFDGADVEGEVAEYRVIHGKWVTFTLKDERSAVGCFMPVWQLKVQLEDGMTVRAVGRPRLRDKGFFSFVLEAVTPLGEGSLKRAFELLKKQLADEGLFAADRKRPLPRFPQHVALITSRDAAAYADFLKVLQHRQGGLTVSFLHTQVQGEDAPRQLLAALEAANTQLQEVDAIVLIRGGGSLEDLQAFNDEQVVRAVASSRMPIVVGVGHERDVCLAELAADVRASTPSNAAELLVRSREELALEIRHMRTQLVYRVRDRLTAGRATSKRLVDILRGQVRGLQQGLAQLVRILRSLSPEQTLRRGYSITRKADGSILTRAADAAEGDEITTRLANGSLRSTVTARHYSAAAK
ncbi:MAG: exodeoxyribonuclease VII large subunit [Candidatus Andersenbacteria bacterium CG10_big_fil_rev_8_21_14_0_10_54_11]|uniref:Exodeoxyribonuclease 7 large subunit n=1 Tax=Candidatus Andersenbacteria bacterium CG10_big_fil_rev_8_21_14_0_10_54_11 TaxID=1974485 RepID=A0A2M6X0C8_9BACT|nr:MAG: exodeoxyribonuclease VII large subunit [Candidatus Andersenbacteria bacterium CG10_big_fil_rev_8_21_14_0_10_54_11]